MYSEIQLIYKLSASAIYIDDVSNSRKRTVVSNLKVAFKFTNFISSFQTRRGAVLDSACAPKERIEGPAVF
jgi:hypothetical protein